MSSLLTLRTAQVYCFAIFLTCWHPSHITISFFFNSTFYLCIIIVIFTWCIWYINWSCWQSYITLSVLMFLWYRQKFFISLYGTRVPWVNMGRGQPGSVSKFPPFLWVKLWVGWVDRGYTEITRYFPSFHLLSTWGAFFSCNIFLMTGQATFKSF